jgi:RNA polymerase sigma factor (sigma-70 family)
MMTTKDKGGFSRPTEATQYEQAQAGCQESLNRLLTHHEGLVYFVVQRQELYGLAYEEALQAGRRGLWRAILGYDLQWGTRFSTYAYVAIIRYVWAAVRGQLKCERRRIPRSILRVYYYEPGVDPAQQQDWADVCQSLLALVSRLPAQQAAVIRGRYGLEGRQPQTQAALGVQMGVSRQRISQLERQALVWLRQPAHSQELRSLLARHNQPQYELADQLAQVWLRRRGGRGRHGRH